MKLVAALALAAACSRSTKAPPVVASAALDCAIAAITTETVRDHDLVPSVLDSLREQTSPAMALAALHRMHKAFKSAVDLSHVAFSLADAGDKDGAHAAADAALAASKLDNDPDAHAAVAFAALTLAWTGDPAAAEKVAAGDGDALLGVVEGAGRAGNMQAAAHALAAADAAPPPPLPDLVTTRRAQKIGALAWMHRVDDAKKELAQEADDGWHLYSSSVLARNAVLAKLPEADAILKEAVDEAARQAQTAEPDAIDAIRGIRLQLAGYLEERGDHAGATAQRARLATPDLGPADLDFVVLLALSAQLAHQSAEADDLLARLGDAVPPDTKAIMAALRGNLAGAITALADVREHRAETLMIVWEKVAAAGDDALAGKLDAAACPKTH